MRPKVLEAEVVRFQNNKEKWVAFVGLLDMTAATEQKIPGNCYPVDKVIHQDNNEIPAGL